MGSYNSKKQQVFKLCRMCQGFTAEDSTSIEVTDKLAVESTLASDDDLTETEKLQEEKNDSLSFVTCVNSFSSIGVQESLKPLEKLPQSKPVFVTPSATIKRGAIIRQRQMNLKNVSRPQLDTTFDWTDITTKLEKDGKGAYLMFSSGNNGSFFIKWSQTFISNALLFCKPSSDSNVPLYKYSSRGNEELLRGIFSSESNYCSAVLLYIRHMRNYNSSIQLLPENSNPDIELHEMLDTLLLGFYHKSSMQVHMLDTQPNKFLKALHEYEAAIAVGGEKASVLLMDLAQKSLTEHVSLSTFLSFGTKYGVSMKF